MNFVRPPKRRRLAVCTSVHAMLGQAALRASARPSLRAPSASAAAVAPVVLHVSDRLDTAWLARRQQFHVPSLRPDCPPLLQVDLGDTDVTTGARAIDNLWVLGRKHPRIRPLAARWLQPAEPWEQLQVCMLCPGVCEPERVALAADLRVEEMDGEVEEMDGKAVHAFNEHVAASGYYRRRRADVHVASQGALRTARSSGCSLLTSGGAVCRRQHSWMVQAATSRLLLATRTCQLA